MGILFDNFSEWKSYAQLQDTPIWRAVMEYEVEQRGKKEEEKAAAE